MMATSYQEMVAIANAKLKLDLLAAVVLQLLLAHVLRFVETAKALGFMNVTMEIMPTETGVQVHVL